jgi:hypothetical protein
MSSGMFFPALGGTVTLKWCTWSDSNRQTEATDFLTTIAFATLSFCGLDFLFIIDSFESLDARRQVSTRSIGGFARDCQVKGFPEFDEFYMETFVSCTQFNKSVVFTNFTTGA